MSKTKCKVNTDSSVCLEDILNSFDSSLKEEHAWALCYQCAKYYHECLSSRKPNVHTASEVHHVYLQTDGNVHENTVKGGPQRHSVRCERDAISGLGLVIYTALDHGNHNDEERVISADLEQLISDMVSDELNSSDSTHHETDDEGIERDSEEGEEEPGTSKGSTHISLQEVIKRCETHLGALTKTQTETHYRAVVRALVAEALELATFLEKVAQGSINLPSCSTKSDLDQLKFSDWARFWMQVMGELRMGVKLKKVHCSRAPIEYELTPYEILMKDIRSRKYNLKKIMVNGDVPSRVSKDAHAIILEFIRSRPPLRKVSERKLPPQARTLTPREQLLNSIKKGRKLRPISRATHMLPEPKQSPEEAPLGLTGRRLIKVDFSQFEDEDDEDDDIDNNSPESTWSRTDYLHLDAYDLATKEFATPSARRRHTLEVCDPAVAAAAGGSCSVPQSRPCSRQSCNSSEADSLHLEPEAARAMQEELTTGRGWQDAISLDDRLSLTLAEIVHIRAVLTKAELEALPVEGSVRHNVESRKVCFLCLKTRFGIFGPWGQRCTLCKRTVCSKCYSRMNIPMEHFSSVPVVLLSPSIMGTPEEELSAFPRAAPSPDSGGGVGSRPSSSMESSTISDPGTVLGGGSSGVARFRAARVVDRLKAPPPMVVCHDCRMMVLQIIKSARANRSAIRNKTLQSLTLNLSPVF